MAFAFLYANVVFLCTCQQRSAMNIYEIGKLNLSGRNFAFKSISEFLGKNFQNQLFLFDGLLFIICIKGTAKITIDYKEYQIDPNNLVVILPRRIYSMKDCSDDLEVGMVLVSSDFLCHLPITLDFDLLKKMAVRPSVKLEEEKLDDLRKIHFIINRYNSEEKLARQIQDTLIHSLILITASSFGNLPLNPDRTFSRQETLVRKFFDLLVDSCETQRSVAYYADKLCVTPKYLTTVVKSISKHPAQNWINEAVLICAKRYIMTTDLTIQQIADRLHFLTASSFVRFFRTHVGCSPLEYRKKANQDL